MSQLACSPVWPPLYAASKYYVVKKGPAESGRATFIGAGFNEAVFASLVVRASPSAADSEVLQVVPATGARKIPAAGAVF